MGDICEEEVRFFRYPGGKNKINKIIQRNLYDPEIDEYREPFFGGGSVGITFLNNINIFFDNLKKVWINDSDSGIFCLWKSVIENHEELKKRILLYSPKTEDFYNFKKELLKNSYEDILEIGLKKLIIHQISYSGLGAKSGSPLGGKNQQSKYKIDCRWNPENICKKIEKINKILNRYDIKCTCEDFSILLKNVGKKTLLYLDPPYYYKGRNLYQLYFKEEDHIRLAKELKKLNCKWVLSYDYCEEIIDLYNWANIIEIPVKYSIRGMNIKKELLISNDNIK